MSLDSNELIQAEARGWLRGPLPEDVECRLQARPDDLQKIATKLPESYDFLSKKKKELFAADRSLHQYLLDRGIGYELTK